MRTVTLSDFLTPFELKFIVELKTAICNKAIGQENDPMYLSYMCEYTVSQGGASC